MSHTVTSKRKLKQLVDEGIVSGWDDPRLPTIRGLRARGFPPKAIRQFCEMIGITKSDSVIDMSILEECVRDELNQTSKRAMCVLNPVKIEIINYPENQVEKLKAPYHPQNPEFGERELPFSREIYIEQDDFKENPPKKYFRLSPGKEVRLRNAYVIRCEEVVYNDNNEIDVIKCTYDEKTLGKNPEGRKVKGVIHWVSKNQAHPVKIFQYDRLFTKTNPAAEDDFLASVNPDSLAVSTAYCEPSLIDKAKGEVFQFERTGYYAVNETNSDGTTAFHRVVNLKDTWGKIES